MIPGHSVGASETSLRPCDRSLAMRAAAGGFPCPLPSASLSPPSRPGGSWNHPDPEYLIKSRKQRVTLRCSPDSGHLSVYWYQQALGQGPQFLVQYFNRMWEGKQTYQGDSQVNSSVTLALNCAWLLGAKRLIHVSLCQQPRHSPACSGASGTETLLPQLRKLVWGYRLPASQTQVLGEQTAFPRQSCLDMF